MVAKVKKELSASQTQAVIKLLEKMDKDRRFIKNWRPISLLNNDEKCRDFGKGERCKRRKTQVGIILIGPRVEPERDLRNHCCPSVRASVRNQFTRKPYYRIFFFFVNR